MQQMILSHSLKTKVKIKMEGQKPVLAYGFCYLAFVP